jgi:hypothetical protein
MIINSQFTQAVENKEIEKVRARIINSISRDPSLQSMNEMLAYAEPRLDGLFQAHDGVALKSSSADWNSEYASFLAGQLILNFSREKLEVMCKVTQFVQANAIRMRKEKSDEAVPLKVIGGGLVTGGVVTTAVGVVVRSMAAVAIGTVGTIAGCVVLILGRNKNE